MHDRLDRTERRILGVLVEKELTTPHLYPLTINALLNGCNQKNAREPIMLLQEFEVDGSLKHLFLSQWVTNSAGGGSRTVKWKHRLRDRLGVDGPALAVMGELLLRGPQTPGALRGHVSRMTKEIPDIGALSPILFDLAALGLAREIPPAPGERSRRWDHLLYPQDEMVDFGADERKATEYPVPDARSAPPSARDDLMARIAGIEARLERIERELGLNDPEDAEESD